MPLLDLCRGGFYHYHMRANVKNVGTVPVADAPRCDIPCFKPDVVQRLSRAIPKDDVLEDPLAVFGALADRTRLKLLAALAGGEELCVCDAAHVLRISISAASHHLRKLRDLKILRYRNDGKMAYYSLRDSTTATLVRHALDAVAKERRRGRTAPR